jgi:hypothetical protein
MFPLRRSILAMLLAGFAAPIAFAQSPKDELPAKQVEDRRDMTQLQKVNERTLVHDQANMSYTIPEGWKEIRPYRLQRTIDPRISTVLGIERAESDQLASISWSPLNPGQKLSEWVRDTEKDKEYGEEYETLKAIYGKARVTTPVKTKYRDFDVYRININGGSDRGDKHDGTLLIFSVEGKSATWMVKARISYPKAADKGRNDQCVTEVLEGFTHLPAKPGSAPK